jgi:PAS domain S-box-containing protein
VSESRANVILLVDDDDGGRYAVSRVLRRAGFDVAEAASGEDALRLAAEQPDLVLLDVNLPDMHGFDVCTRLKSDSRTRHIPVVHISATFVGSDAVTSGLDRGADGYLTHPVDPRELVATLNAFLRLAEARRELHEKAELLSAFVRSSGDAIYVKDLEGRYVLFNPAAEAVTGKAAAEVIGHDDRTLFPGPEAEEVMAVDRRAVAAGGPVGFEEVVTAADGEAHTFLSVKGPLFDADGEPYAVFGVARDITERKRAEDEVRRLNDELESRVALRTLELEQSNRELEAFVYSVSHDLRAPLRAVAGFAQIVAEDNAAQLDEDGRHNLQRVRSAALHMAEIIDHLLRLSQLVRGGLRLETVDVSALAGEVVAELRAQEPEGHVEVEIQAGLTARADTELMRAVLVNLLSNAVKFTSHNAAATITVGREDTAQGPAFFVRDDGAGFDMAYAGKLFGAFQRLHSASEFPGTGIGLTTVQRIVERHGGHVWAEGEVDGGATFWFTLPDDAV